jgi:CubicO group peptidase (beta-lactamase class C family)
MSRLIAIILSVSIFSIPAFSQRRNQNRRNQNRNNNLEQRLDKLVQNKVRQFNVPGYSIIVIQNGRTILNKGYGFADVEQRVPVTPQTVFGLASITKTFTALALLMLVDEGKVNLDDPVDKYFNGLSPAYKRITVRQLASMSSGFPSDTGENKGLDWQQQWQHVQNMPLEFKPGTKYRYANLNYRVLGGIIEKVSGKTYMAFLRERILNPLGMTQTLPTDGRFAQPIAVPYNVKRNGRLERLDRYKSPETNFAAGMLASNTIDMAKYAQALLDRKFLSPSGYRLMWKTREGLIDAKKGKPSNWAFGWTSTNPGGRSKLAMNGALPGVASSIMIFPDDKLIVVGLANLTGDPHKIATAVANEILGSDTGVDEVDE